MTEPKTLPFSWYTDEEQLRHERGADLRALLAVRRSQRGRGDARLVPRDRRRRHPGPRHPRRRRDAARVHQRLPAPWRRARGGLRGEELDPVPLPRLDLRPRRHAARGAAGRPRAGRSTRPTGRCSLRVSDCGGRFCSSIPTRRRARSRSSSASCRRSSPATSTSTASCSTRASSSARTRTGRSSPRTSSSATTARPRIRRSATRWTCIPTATCSKRTPRSAPSSAGRRATGERGQFHLLYPNTGINVFPGPANLSIGPMHPRGPNRTERYLDYFFAPDVDEDWRREFFAFDDQVGREDRALVESVQRGVSSGMLDHGRLLLDAEPLLAAFQRWAPRARSPRGERAGSHRRARARRRAPRSRAARRSAPKSFCSAPVTTGAAASLTGESSNTRPSTRHVTPLDAPVTDRGNRQRGQRAPHGVRVGLDRLAHALDGDPLVVRARASSRVSADRTTGSQRPLSIRAAVPSSSSSAVICSLASSIIATKRALRWIEVVAPRERPREAVDGRQGRAQVVAGQRDETGEAAIRHRRGTVVPDGRDAEQPDRRPAGLRARDSARPDEGRRDRRPEGDPDPARGAREDLRRGDLLHGRSRSGAERRAHVALSRALRRGDRPRRDRRGLPRRDARRAHRRAISWSASTHCAPRCGSRPSTRSSGRRRSPGCRPRRSPS